MESIFRKLVVLVVLVIAAGQMAYGQQRPWITEKGFLTGAGYGVNQYSLPEGKYIPVFFMAHIGMDLIRPSALRRGQRMMLFAEPQINAVVIKKPGSNGHEAEFGMNVGIQPMFPLTRNLYIYTLLSAGPHYITVHSERQAHGFIFSDNMGSGVYYFVGKNVAMNAGMRIRHMSNANTRMPNHGINTVQYVLGISFILR